MVKTKTVLVLYITERSGHHSAALALKKALEQEDPLLNVLCLNAFRYIFPVAERITHRLYLTVIKRVPGIWGKVYDNPRFVLKTGKIKGWIYRLAVRKFSKLMKQVAPDAIVCTQAFPVGIAAEYKATTGSRLPLVGVLTDFFPHAFWVHDQVDHYIVPCDESARFLEGRAIPPAKIHSLGIPIDPKFSRQPEHRETLSRYGLVSDLPVVLIMGGGHGLGPISKVLTICDASEIPLQFVVICGINKKLYSWLNRTSFRNKVVFFKYTDEVDRLMSIASVLISKPGGITTAEALAKHVPMIILNPIPGQEARNTELLVRRGVAAAVGVPGEVLPAVMNMLAATDKKQNNTPFSQTMKEMAKPDAALQIARLVIRTL